MIADGFVAAQFPHRTSRLGDPHLHWHVLVANMARGIDGRWTALDGKRSIAPSGPSACCSRQRCAASSADDSESSGVRCTTTRPRSPASRRGCCASSRSAANRSPSGWSTGASRALAAKKRGPPGNAARASRPPADFASVEAAWRERAEAARMGPDGTRPAPRDQPSRCCGRRSLGDSHGSAGRRAAMDQRSGQ